MSADRQAEMRAHLAALRAAHEADAVRQTLFAFVAYGEKVEVYFNWLMAGTGAALAFVFTQWASVVGALGRGCAIAVVVILLLALLAGLVGRFENYQAQTIRVTWASLPQALTNTRERYAADVAGYVQAMHGLFGAQLPADAATDMDPQRIGRKVKDLMPPDFNTGWRAPFWWIMTAVSLALTGREYSIERTGEDFHGTAQAAYRVGSAMWLVVFYQVLLIVAAVVVFIGLSFH
jgi:hypothetical protein